MALPSPDQLRRGVRPQGGLPSPKQLRGQKGIGGQIASGTFGLLGEQARGFKKGTKEAFARGRELNPLQQLLLPAKQAGALLKSAGGRVIGAGKSAVETVGAAPEAFRVATGRGSAEDVKELERVTKGQKEAVSGVAEFIPTPAAQFAAGTFKGQQKATEQGFQPTEALTRGLVTGGERAALLKVIQKAFKKPTAKDPTKPGVRQKLTLENRQINAAVKQAKINSKRGREILKAAEKASADDLAIKPIEVTGKRFNKYISDLNKVNKKAGQNIGTFTKKLGSKKSIVNTKGIVKQFEKQLNNANIRIKNGKLDFSGSDLQGLPQTSKALLQKQYDLFRKQGFTPRELLANQRDLGNRLFSGSKTAEFTGAERILNKLRDMSTKTLKKQFPQAADDFATFSKTADALDDVQRLVGPTGAKSPQALRRLFGNARGQSSEIIRKLEKLADDLKLDSGKNIAKEANFSIVAEEVAGVKPPTSLVGQVTGELGIPTKGGILKTLADKTAGAAVGTPQQNLLRLLQSPQTGQSAVGRLGSFTTRNLDKISSATGLNF